MRGLRCDGGLNMADPEGHTDDSACYQGCQEQEVCNCCARVKQRSQNVRQTKNFKQFNWEFFAQNTKPIEPIRYFIHTFLIQLHLVISSILIGLGI